MKDDIQGMIQNHGAGVIRTRTWTADFM